MKRSAIRTQQKAKSAKRHVRCLQVVDTFRGKGTLVQRQGPPLPGTRLKPLWWGQGEREGEGLCFQEGMLSVKVREVLGQAAVPSAMQLTLILGATLSLGWKKGGTLERCNLLPAAPDSPPLGVLSHEAHLPLHSCLWDAGGPVAEWPDWARSTVRLSPGGHRWIPSTVSGKTFFSRNQCLSWFKK